MDGSTVAWILVALAIVLVVGTYLIGEIAYRMDGMPE